MHCTRVLLGSLPTPRTESRWVASPPHRSAGRALEACRDKSDTAASIASLLRSEGYWVEAGSRHRHSVGRAAVVVSNASARAPQALSSRTNATAKRSRYVAQKDRLRRYQDILGSMVVVPHGHYLFVATSFANDSIRE